MQFEPKKYAKPHPTGCFSLLKLCMIHDDERSTNRESCMEQACQKGDHDNVADPVMMNHESQIFTAFY